MDLSTLCKTFRTRADAWEQNDNRDVGEIVASEIRTIVDAFEVLSSDVEAAQAIEPEIKHGVNCVKVQHNGGVHFGGYLHDANDDSPYEVDGYDYCGRCHHAI